MPAQLWHCQLIHVSLQLFCCGPYIFFDCLSTSTTFNLALFRDWMVSEIVDGHVTVIPNFMTDDEVCALQRNLVKWELRICTLLLA